jgi:hypothetical protein
MIAGRGPNGGKKNPWAGEFLRERQAARCGDGTRGGARLPLTGRNRDCAPPWKEVAPIALFCESAASCSLHHPRAGRDREDSHMSKSLRALVACAVLAGLAACAAPPPAPVVTAPPPKPLDAKTQLENHM